MPPLSLSRETIDFRLAALAAHHGNASLAARSLGISRSALQNTIDAARRAGVALPAVQRRPHIGFDNHPGRIDLDIDCGVVLVGSDAHIWPGPPTIAMHAFERAIEWFRTRGLRAVVLNGDSLDGARISRYPSIGWEHKPTLAEELAAVQAQKRRLRQLGGDHIEYVWPRGNHDQRFESAVANRLPEFAHIDGVHLRDHFPDWKCCWNLVINNELVIRHRMKGGIHATYNNTLHAGKSICTGHLHALRVTPFTDYNGTRWGIDCGTLATPYGPQFIHYTEAGPVNWRSGFVVFTFRRGALLQPELVLVRDESSWEFRGRVYELAPI